MTDVDALSGSRTLVVVDDQAEFVEAVRARITRDPGLAIIGEASNGETALELVSTLPHAPDGILLDIEMPGLDGFETARRLRSVAPSVRIILTSASDNAHYSAAAARLGAVFLPKRSLSATAILRLLD